MGGRVSCWALTMHQASALGDSLALSGLQGLWEMEVRSVERIAMLTSQQACEVEMNQRTEVLPAA